MLSLVSNSQTSEIGYVISASQPVPRCMSPSPLISAGFGSKRPDFSLKYPIIHPSMRSFFYNYPLSYFYPLVMNLSHFSKNYYQSVVTLLFPTA